MSSTIQAEGLVKGYGEVRALDGVSFSVPEGSVFGVLGPNGAGKSTDPGHRPRAIDRFLGTPSSARR